MYCAPSESHWMIYNTNWRLYEPLGKLRLHLFSPISPPAGHCWSVRLWKDMAINWEMRFYFFSHPQKVLGFFFKSSLNVWIYLVINCAFRPVVLFYQKKKKKKRVKRLITKKEVANWSTPTNTQGHHTWIL